MAAARAAPSGRLEDVCKVHTAPADEGVDTAADIAADCVVLSSEMVDVTARGHGLQMAAISLSWSSSLRAMWWRATGVGTGCRLSSSVAALDAASGWPVTELAERFGVFRQSVHALGPAK